MKPIAQSIVGFILGMVIATAVIQFVKMESAAEARWRTQREAQAAAEQERAVSEQRFNAAHDAAMKAYTENLEEMKSTKGITMLDKPITLEPGETVELNIESDETEDITLDHRDTEALERLALKVTDATEEEKAALTKTIRFFNRMFNQGK